MSTPAPTGPQIGPFVVLEMLGEGSMGEVYRAYDSRLGREVALKLIKQETASESGLRRFAREGQITALLQHPGIVCVHSAGMAGTSAYLAYELIEGAQTLEEAFPSASLEQRVTWLRDAARAVGHAHLKGVIHRDLKPENILLDESGGVKVADFGLALVRAEDRLTRTGVTVGSPSFMSPEQVCGERENLVPASDVWALGVVLYQALTDRLPFDGATLLELGEAIRRSQPTRVRALNPQAPPALERVCLLALQADSSKRPRDGEAFAQLLDRALENPGHGLRSGRLALASAGAVLALAGLGLAWWPGKAPPDPVSEGAQPSPESAEAVPAKPVPAPSEAPSALPTTREALRVVADEGNEGALLELARFHAIGRDGPRDEARALQLWLQAVTGGQSRSLRALARAHELGIGLPSNGNQAATLYRRAAEQGDRVAAAHLGRLFEIGHGVPADAKEAERWYRRATQGARQELHLVCRGWLEGPARNVPRAVVLLRRAAEQGESLAMLELGRVGGTKWLGLGPERARKWAERAWKAGLVEAAAVVAARSETPREALEWLERGKAAGSLDARFSLAIARLEGGYGTSKDPRAARGELKALVEAGHEPSIYRLGVLLRKGLGGPEDRGGALELYRRAANTGDVDAAFELASAYEQGDLGLAKDAAQASAWYLRSARGGCAYAMPKVSSRYANGHGLATDLTRARAWLRRGALAGDSWACYGLGEAYLEGGLGLARSGRDAERWHLAAASVGNKWSMYSLAHMYLQGKAGIRVDASGGMAWLVRSLEAGNGHVIYDLVSKLEKGEGVPADPLAARRYLQVGAKLKGWNARWQVARCYVEGQGTKPDLAAALAVYALLQKQGSGAQASLEAARLLILADRHLDAVPWLRVALERGSGYAAAQLGLIRERGLDGAPRNSAEALKLFLGEAGLKDVTALTLGARRLEQGRGAPVDLVRAGQLLATAERLANSHVAARRSKGRAGALLERAELRLELGRFVEVLKEIGATSPSRERALRTLHARARARTWSDPQAAIADLDSCLTLHPGQAETLAYRARIRAISGDAKGALADCAAASERSWYPARVHAVRAMLELEEKPLHALAHCQRAQEQAGGFCAEAWALSALAHARRGELVDAGRDAARACALTRSNPLVSTYAGRALVLVKELADARSCFRRALKQLGPSHPLAKTCREELAQLERQR